MPTPYLIYDDTGKILKQGVSSTRSLGLKAKAGQHLKVLSSFKKWDKEYEIDMDDPEKNPKKKKKDP